MCRAAGSGAREAANGTHLPARKRAGNGSGADDGRRQAAVEPVDSPRRRADRCPRLRVERLNSESILLGPTDITGIRHPCSGREDEKIPEHAPPYGSGDPRRLRLRHPPGRRAALAESAPVNVGKLDAPRSPAKNTTREHASPTGRDNPASRLAPATTPGTSGGSPTDPPADPSIPGSRSPRRADGHETTTGVRGVRPGTSAGAAAHRVPTDGELGDGGGPGAGHVREAVPALGPGGPGRLDRPVRPPHAPQHLPRPGATTVVPPDPAVRGAAGGRGRAARPRRPARPARRARPAVTRSARGPRTPVLGGFDVAETAATLGCSAGTVKSQTSAAIGALRRLLPGYAGDAVPITSDGSAR